MLQDCLNYLYFHLRFSLTLYQDHLFLVIEEHYFLGHIKRKYFLVLNHGGSFNVCNAFKTFQKEIIKQYLIEFLHLISILFSLNFNYNKKNILNRQEVILNLYP